MVEHVEVIRAAVLGDVAHGFCGRRGGVSTGLVSGLNVGLGSIGPAGDNAAAVAENRGRAAAAVLPGAPLVTVYQVHSRDCVTVAEPWGEGARPHADALVTDRPGILLGILTADCAPVLLADREAGVVGAAHAGWNGALAGVTDQTIEAMCALGARRSRIAAAIGPCIARASYEVDDRFRDRFGDNAEHFALLFEDSLFDSGRAGHWQFDLEGYVAERLRQAGIAMVQPLGLDTYAAPERFFSFRRATHRAEPAYGRQIALIGQTALKDL